MPIARIERIMKAAMASRFKVVRFIWEQTRGERGESQNKFCFSFERGAKGADLLRKTRGKFLREGRLAK